MGGNTTCVGLRTSVWVRAHTTSPRQPIYLLTSSNNSRIHLTLPPPGRTHSPTRILRRSALRTHHDKMVPTPQQTPILLSHEGASLSRTCTKFLTSGLSGAYDWVIYVRLGMARSGCPHSGYACHQQLLQSITSISLSLNRLILSAAVGFFFTSMTFLEGKGITEAKRRVEAVRFVLSPTFIYHLSSLF